MTLNSLPLLVRHFKQAFNSLLDRFFHRHGDRPSYLKYRKRDRPTNSDKTIQASTFNQVLENIESLSIEDQEALIELMQRRFVERRRAEIAGNITQAKEEYQTNQVFRGTFDNVIAELNH